jgi:hypothetical protein
MIANKCKIIIKSATKFMNTGVKQEQTPWIVSVDNIFLDVASEFPNNDFLVEHGIKPGTQNTAIDDRLKSVAL